MILAVHRKAESATSMQERLFTPHVVSGGRDVVEVHFKKHRKPYSLNTAVQHGQ